MERNKQKVMVFFSDISGTFSPSTMSNNSLNEYHKIVNLLENIKEQTKINKIIFCFITADERISLLLKYIKLFKEHIETEDIILGLQFFSSGEIKVIKENEYILNNHGEKNLKEKKIKRYIDVLKEEYNITNIIYADDFANCNTRNNLIQLLNDKHINVTIMIPSTCEMADNNTFGSPLLGIDGLIDCMQKTTFSDSEACEIPAENIGIGNI